MKLQKINIKSLPTPIIIMGGAVLTGAIVAGSAFALYRNRKHKKQLIAQLEKHMTENHWNAMIEDYQRDELKTKPSPLNDSKPNSNQEGTVKDGHAVTFWLNRDGKLILGED